MRHSSSLCETDSPSELISQLCEATRLPQRKFLDESLFTVIQEVILGTRESLDPYCHARAKFFVTRMARDCPVKTVVRALAKLSSNMTQPSSEGVLPRLLEALPPKTKLAVLLAGFWLEDKTEVVVNVAMEMSNFRCKRAAASCVVWFKTTSSVEHVRVLNTNNYIFSNTSI
jgi:hypothetical protein